MNKDEQKKIADFKTKVDALFTKAEAGDLSYDELMKQVADACKPEEAPKKKDGLPGMGASEGEGLSLDSLNEDGE